MKSINKENAKDILSKVNNKIYDMVYENDFKIHIKHELDLVLKYIENAETDPLTMLNNDHDVLAYNILYTEELVEIYGYGLDESNQEVLYDLLKTNLESIDLGNWMSIYEQIYQNMDMRFVFRNCPEIIEFITNNEIN
jgi:hypothetical protein